MKKRASILVIVIILILAIVAYILFQNNKLTILGSNSRIEELQNQINRLQKERRDDIFKKKMECYTLDIDSDIKRNRTSYGDNYSIGELFYSPGEKTCMAIIYLYDSNRFSTIRLYDILKKQRLLETYNSPSEDCVFSNSKDQYCVDSNETFNAKVTELKGLNL